MSTRGPILVRDALVLVDFSVVLWLMAYFFCPPLVVVEFSSCHFRPLLTGIEMLQWLTTSDTVNDRLVEAYPCDQLE